MLWRDPEVNIAWGIETRSFPACRQSNRMPAPPRESMKLKILLTGNNGRVGAELTAILPRLGEVAAFNRQELDLCKPDEIRRAIRNVRPSILVNAAAYTAVDNAEDNEQMAYTVNAEAPGVMADEAKKIGAVLVHYSTAYVFDGSNNVPYTETDTPNPVNVYGKSKLAGEAAIRASGVAHLILRTAWIYSTRGRNFLLTMLRLATEWEELRVVRDQFGAPCWCREIAKGTESVLRLQLLGRSADDVASLNGVYHMSARGQMSWHEFAEGILQEAARMPRGVPWFEAATSGKPLLARRVKAITTGEYPTRARRPAYSVLSNRKFEQTFGVKLPSCFEQLRAVFAVGRERK